MAVILLLKSYTGFYMSTDSVFTPVDNNRVQQDRDFDWWSNLLQLLIKTCRYMYISVCDKISVNKM